MRRVFEEAEDAQISSQLHPAVAEAVRLLSRPERKSDPLSLQELSDRVGLSPSHLSRLFAGQVGIRLNHFRARQCHERFLELRRAAPGKKLLNLALEAGFGSYAQFHRVMKSLKGCSPSRLEE